MRSESFPLRKGPGCGPAFAAGCWVHPTQKASIPSGLALGFGRSMVSVSYSARGGSGFRVLSLGFRDRD